MQDKRSRVRLGWLAVLLVILLLVSSATFEWWSFGRPEPEATPIVGLQPQTGGIDLGSTGNNGSANAETTLTNSGKIQPGLTAIANTSVRLYADASARSLILAEYDLGARFVIEEPSGNYSKYPVQVNEQSWCRVRAEDGLVGWTRLEALDVQ
jgi:hypothetical protein